MGLVIANVSPWPVWDPVATAALPDVGCQHPRDQAFLAGCKGDFIARSECAVQGVKSSTVQVWKGKFLRCVSLVMLWVPKENKQSQKIE